MQENVELCLELQMDDYVKDILASPKKCRSTLLDVTVIKPVELEAFGTQRVNVLKAEQVRKLIASMEKQRREKQRLIDNLRCDDTIIKVRKHDTGSGRKVWRKDGKKVQIRNQAKKSVSDYEESCQPAYSKIRKSLRNVKTKITDLKDRSVVVSQTTTDETTSNELRYYGNAIENFNCGDHLKNTYVYRAARSIQDLKSVLVCKNRNKLGNNGQFDGKCLCENCGIVGHLLECQKHPYYSGLSELPNETLKPNDKKKEKPKREVTGDVNVEALTKRIKTLEERLAVQEERAIPRDYFKKIIGKLVANFSPRSELSSPRSEIKIDKKPKQKVKNATRVNQSDIPPELISCFHVTQQPRYERDDMRLPKFENTKVGFPNVASNKSTVTDDEPYYSGNFWRWGGEMLKPGIDLKKKIVALLHDILSKFNLADRTCNLDPQVGSPRPRGETNYNDLFKKFVDHMNTKVFTAQMQEGYNCFPTPRNTPRGYQRNSENSSVSHDYGPRVRDNQGRREGFLKNTGAKRVNVAYVNPKLSVWDEESVTNKCGNVHYPMGVSNKIGKEEFLRIIMKAKRSQKELLWRNIWNQAKANGQTKHDKINIKVPMLSKEGKVNDQIYEIELPIGEVEKLLRCNRLSFR